ncbi:hypothetical protein IAR50_005222 [Cryptococcus sp. DSM 104548]
MQVEYESSPAIGEHHAEESFTFRPGHGAPESDEEEAEEHDGAEGSKKTKTKRVIKQRQSLAEKQPGTTMFPISKVKKIVKADREVDIMSSEAVFMCAIAAEYFIKHFMEEGYTKARLEKRKIINYKDMANVVARNEEFDFLKDVIPIPITMSEALERRRQKQVAEDNQDEGVPASFNDEDLPPLAPSTNPLFPNAVVKKAAGAHPKGSINSGKKESGDGAQGRRKSARRSTVGQADESFDLNEFRGSQDNEQRERGHSVAVTSDGGDERMDEE